MDVARSYQPRDGSTSTYRAAVSRSIIVATGRNPFTVRAERGFRVADERERSETGEGREGERARSIRHAEALRGTERKDRRI